MRYRSAVLAVVVCAVSVLTFGQKPAVEKPLSAADQALVSAENSYIEAAKKGDVAYFKRVLTDDFSFVPFDGQLYERQDFIDQFSDGGMNLQAYNMKVIPAGDSVEIVTYDVILRLPPAEDQGPPPRYQHFSSTWVKQGDTWKLKFQQMTPSHWGDW
jgi:ketosteroid isomerase-like protein